MHGAAGLVNARRHAPDAVILSPVFPTASHPGAAALGPLRFAALAHASSRPVIALGGMTEERFLRLTAFGAYGWAAIDGLSRQNRQKRNAVPT